MTIMNRRNASLEKSAPFIIYGTRRRGTSGKQDSPGDRRPVSRKATPLHYHARPELCSVTAKSLEKSALSNVSQHLPMFNHPASSLFCSIEQKSRCGCPTIPSLCPAELIYVCRRESRQEGIAPAVSVSLRTLHLSLMSLPVGLCLSKVPTALALLYREHSSHHENRQNESYVHHALHCRSKFGCIASHTNKVLLDDFAYLPHL